MTEHDAALGAALLSQARAAIARELGLAVATPLDHPALAQPGASFVTLHRAGALRGCIGSLDARQSLGEDVRQHARAAAFADPRFAALRAEEWPQLSIEVSLLGSPQPLPVSNEAQARAALVPGRDGVILSCRGRRATFLPQVWDSLPQPADFLTQLKLKAGLPAGYWSDDIELAVYTVQHWDDTQGA